MGYFITFSVAGRTCALPVSEVERVLRVVEISVVPDPPKNFLGIINLHGSLVSIFDLQAVFTHQQRELELSDAIIITRAYKKPVGLLVQEIIGIKEQKEDEVLALQDSVPGIPHLGLSTFQDNTILITHVEEWVSTTPNSSEMVKK